MTPTPPHHALVNRLDAERAKHLELRLADHITAFVGSMPFVYIRVLLLGVWMLVFERSPWRTLTLAVSLEAIFLSRFVTIGQNHQAAFQQVKADYEYLGNRWMPSLGSPVAKVVRSVRSYLAANGALLISAAVGAAIFAVLIRWSANVYEAVANGDGVSALDRPTLELAVSQRTPAGERWVTAFTNLGSAIPMTFSTLAVIAAMYVRWRRQSVPLMMVIAATGSLIFTGVGKTVVGRARPPLELAVPPYEYTPSFPSGHTLNSTVIALMAAYLAWWLSKNLWVRVVAPVLGAGWAAAMGLSRVYLGHHWLTDVIFAWVIGLAWLTLLITVHRILLMLDSRDRRVIEQGEVPDQPHSKFRPQNGERLLFTPGPRITGHPERTRLAADSR